LAVPGDFVPAAGRTSPWVAAALAALAWLAPAPARAQQPDSAALRPPAAPNPSEHPSFGRDFWLRLRDEARRFTSSAFPEFRFASHYGISAEMAGRIERAARAEGVDPELAFRLVRAESRFNPRARSRVGALGLTQLMPGTARSIDRSLRTEAQILDPDANLRTGFRYLRQLLDMFDGDVRLALLAYNRGEVRVIRLRRQGRDPENGYSHRVLGTRTANPYRGPGRIAKETPPPAASTAERRINR
jgi:soluble lytic murein transglycosylase-like protein